jgi:hypothetical protein
MFNASPTAMPDNRAGAAGGGKWVTRGLPRDGMRGSGSIIPSNATRAIKPVGKTTETEDAVGSQGRSPGYSGSSTIRAAERNRPVTEPS